MKGILTILIVAAILCSTTVVNAQQTQADSVASLTVDSLAQETPQKSSFFRRLYNYFANSNEDKTQVKDFDFSIIGGPHYSSDIKLGIGLVAAGLYRVDKSDMSIPPSNVTLFGDITTTGFYLLGIRGNTLLKGAKYRLDYNTYFFSMPSQFWGIGYDHGLAENPSTYKRQQMQFKVDFMYRIANKFYLGVNGSFQFIQGLNFSNIDYLEGQKQRYTNVGAGVFLLYDSRDAITSAHRGIYMKLDQRFFPSFFGNDQSFTRTELVADFFHPLWKGAVLAYDLHAEVNSSKTPWTMLALMGSSNRMRGYYEGRYRDKGMIETQIELRQRVYGRSGVVAWIGAGNVFPSMKKFSFNQTLPNYGVGYRWEFKNRVNVRLDYGFGKNQSGFIFNINEAF